MNIGTLLARPQPSISFEFFPPKTDAGVENLMATIEGLRVLDPAYVSVTYGAGGSSRQRSIEVVTRIKAELGIEPMAHVTCVGHSRDELRRLFDELGRAGVENVMALRGDPPQGTSRFEPTAGGFRYAKDLIELLAREFTFCIGAAAYPEKHQEAESIESDIANAMAKVRAGATFLVTQFFFDNEAYFSYVARLRAAGVDVPVVPGIMPITNYDAIARMTKMSGASLPERLLSELEARAAEPDAIADLGVAYTALQCHDLLANGAPGLHFYTLNKSTATRAVVSALLAMRSFVQPPRNETVART
ncbi:MAG: methylenetetrahydrofolate reductase [NAD(P)H] [Candidatus Eremiobacteraeota bacterium]|nr:methylenetetrahydrofolate reductase [NAD(P)H] [Candidatus Eremiobacteraeota bacterium]